jgi:predicted Na+-dependent transporter
MRGILLDVLRGILSLAIALAAFTTGLGAHAADARSLWRRPARLGSSLFAVLVLVPLWALLLLQLMPLDRMARTGILIAVLAVGLGPVAGMNRMRVDSPAARRALELNLAVLAGSAFFVPAMFFGLAALFHRQVTLGWGAVARVVFLRALLPCLLGLLFARVRPLVAARIQGPAARVVNVIALLVLVVALLATGRQLAAVRPAVWITCLAIAAGALAIGHLWAGDDAALRPALATASVMRFPALALLLAKATGQATLVMPSVLAFLLVALLAEGVYRAIGKRRARRTGSPGRARPRTAAATAAG